MITAAVTHPETDPANLATLRALWEAASVTHPDDHLEHLAEARKDDRERGRNAIADWAGEVR
jgi:hypothetical protein